LSPRALPTCPSFPYTTLFRSELDARLFREAERHGVGGVRDRKHAIRPRRRLLTRQLTTQGPPHGVHRAMEHRAVGSREIHQLERSEEHTSELQSPCNLVCRLL